MNAKVAAVTGLHGGDNPQPGNAVIRSLRRAYPNLTIVGLVYDASGIGSLRRGRAPDGRPGYTIPYASAGAVRCSNGSTSSRGRILDRHPDPDARRRDRDDDPPGARNWRPAASEPALPNRDAFRVRSKAKLAELCQECGCDSPETRAVRDLEELLKVGDEIGFPPSCSRRTILRRRPRRSSSRPRADVSGRGAPRWGDAGPRPETRPRRRIRL